MNDLLKMLKDSDLGIKIGSLTLNAVAFADDIAVFADNPAALQILLNYAYHYSNLHLYLLQPQRSVILPIFWNTRCKMKTVYTWTLGEEPMPIVDKALHLGIIRTVQVLRKQNMRQWHKTYPKRERHHTVLYSTV